ncbi:hypothetical protein NPIL_657221 [Nephila pilipes]|uniref:Uncharacterized protein n=1 Tax=Nephila pilipes TaxID=299642 RepID=A0A8X6R843_NEPPI|nr:hypothetical protein NPIL_657221 [Nephila pilipes]
MEANSTSVTTEPMEQGWWKQRLLSIFNRSVVIPVSFDVLLTMLVAFIRTLELNEPSMYGIWMSRDSVADFDVASATLLPV